jgi:hypothetical protein
MCPVPSVMCIAVLSSSNIRYYGQMFVMFKKVVAGIDVTCDGNSKGGHPLF